MVQFGQDISQEKKGDRIENIEAELWGKAGSIDPLGDVGKKILFLSKIIISFLSAECHYVRAIVLSDIILSATKEEPKHQDRHEIKKVQSIPSLFAHSVISGKAIRAEN